MINLEKNFCLNYQWKTLETQVMVWKNSCSSSLVSWATLLLRKKCVRGNNMPFMNKTLTHVPWKRSYLRNRYLKYKCPVNRINYVK